MLRTSTAWSYLVRRQRCHITQHGPKCFLSRTLPLGVATFWSQFGFLTFTMTVIKQTRASDIAIDDATLALIIEIQRQDVEHLGSMAKGKQRERSTPSDAEIALKLHLEELASATVSALDRRIARSIQMAVREDANILKRMVAEEDMATRDRNMSLALCCGGTRQPTPASETTTDLTKSTEDEDVEFIEKMAYLYVTGEHDDTEDIYGVSDDGSFVVGEGAESSKWAAFSSKSDSRMYLLR